MKCSVRDVDASRQSPQDAGQPKCELPPPCKLRGFAREGRDETSSYIEWLARYRTLAYAERAQGECKSAGVPTEVSFKHASRDHGRHGHFLSLERVEFFSTRLTESLSSVAVGESACHGRCGSNDPQMSTILLQLGCRDGAVVAHRPYFAPAQP